MEGSENRLVTMSTGILRLLLDGGTNANQIVKQTSSDRTYVFNVINMLQQEGLISESRDPKHSQKKIKDLTALGREIAELVKLIDPYTEACHKLKESKEKYFNAIQNKSSNSSLGETDIKKNNSFVKQTKESESKQQLDLCAKGIAILEYETADYIKDLTIFTYSSLLRRFNVQKTTKVILNQIIKSATKRQIDTMLNNIEEWKGDDPSELINQFSEHSLRITELPIKMKQYGLLSNKFISKEAKEVLLSVVPLFKSQKRSIQYNISYKNIKKELIKITREQLKEGFKQNAFIKWFKEQPPNTPIPPYPEEDPSEEEMKAFYDEIWKTQPHLIGVSIPPPPEEDPSEEEMKAFYDEILKASS